MDCQQVQELLEAYVLDALDLDEYSAVSAHLAQCPDCRRQLAEYQAIIQLLPAALAVASPMDSSGESSVRLPVALKERILQGLDTPSTAGPAPAAQPSANGNPLSPRQDTARRARRRILMPLAAAMLVIAL